VTKTALLVILCAVFCDVALCASPPQEERKAIALCDISRSTRDTAQPSSRGEMARKARGSLDSATLRPWVVLNKRMFSIPESVYSEI
jgi:hypothetical protein